MGTDYHIKLTTVWVIIYEPNKILRHLYQIYIQMTIYVERYISLILD